MAGAVRGVWLTVCQVWRPHLKLGVWVIGEHVLAVPLLHVVLRRGGVVLVEAVVVVRPGGRVPLDRRRGVRLEARTGPDGGYVQWR